MMIIKIILQRKKKKIKVITRTFETYPISTTKRILLASAITK